MKKFFAFCTVIFCTAPSFAADIFDCHFSADEGLGAAPSTADFKITQADVGKKLVYLSTGELIFALPSVDDTSSQLELYVGGACDGCTAYRFYQSDIFENGKQSQFTSAGKFDGNEYAKSVFSYKIECSADL